MHLLLLPGVLSRGEARSARGGRSPASGAVGGVLGASGDVAGTLLAALAALRGAGRVPGDPGDGPEAGDGLDAGQRGERVPDVHEVVLVPRAEAPLPALRARGLRGVQSLPDGAGAHEQAGARVPDVLLRTHERRRDADGDRGAGGGAALEGRLPAAEGDREGVVREGAAGAEQARPQGVRAEDPDEVARAGAEAGGAHAQRAEDPGGDRPPVSVPSGVRVPDGGQALHRHGVPRRRPALLSSPAGSPGARRLIGSAIAFPRIARGSTRRKSSWGSAICTSITCCIAI